MATARPGATTNGRPDQRSGLAQRLVTSIIGIPIIIGLTLLGGVPYTVAVAGILAAASFEFLRASDPARQTSFASPRRTLPGLAQQRPLAYLGIAAVALVAVASHEGLDYLNGALLVSLFLTFVALIRMADTQLALRDWLWVSGTLIYVGFLGAHLVLLRRLPDGLDWTLLAVFATFATDTIAYFTGKAFGRIHVTPEISPGKTLEGFAGGLLGGFVAVILINWITDLKAGGDIVFLAVLLPIAAEVGDLAESLLKRSTGVKDASSLIPGHGGFLDRLDSILFTAPLVYYFVLWFAL